MKVINSKHQAPNNKQIPSTKHQISNGLKFENWNLKFVWNLEFVIWNLFGISGLGFCILILIFTVNLRAAVGLLTFPQGAENIGMGETGVLSYKRENILNNSSSLAFNDNKFEVSFSNLKWVEDTNYSNFYFSFKTWGAGLSYFDYGSFSTFGTEPVKQGEFKAYDGLFFISKAFKTNDLTSFGLTLKIFNEKIDKYSGTGSALDFSFSKRFIDEFTKNETLLYLGIKNLGGKIKLRDKKEEIEKIIEGGFGFKLRKGGWFNILLSEVENSLYLKAGIESFLSKVLKFRLGYVYSSKNMINSLSGIRAGIGINFSSFSINYALYPFQDVSYHHIFSVSFTWK